MCQMYLKTPIILQIQYLDAVNKKVWRYTYSTVFCCLVNNHSDLENTYIKLYAFPDVVDPVNYKTGSISTHAPIRFYTTLSSAFVLILTKSGSFIQPEYSLNEKCRDVLL